MTPYMAIAVPDTNPMYQGLDAEAKRTHIQSTAKMTYFEGAHTKC